MLLDLFVCVAIAKKKELFYFVLRNNFAQGIYPLSRGSLRILFNMYTKNTQTQNIDLVITQSVVALLSNPQDSAQNKAARCQSWSPTAANLTVIHAVLPGNIVLNFSLRYAYLTLFRLLFVTQLYLTIIRRRT